jgi:hypothetical protein
MSGGPRRSRRPRLRAHGADPLGVPDASDELVDAPVREGTAGAEHDLGVILLEQHADPTRNLGRPQSCQLANSSAACRYMSWDLDLWQPPPTVIHTGAQNGSIQRLASFP